MNYMVIWYKQELLECKLDPEDEVFFSQWNWYYRKGYVGRQRTKKTLRVGIGFIYTEKSYIEAVIQ